MNTLVLDDSELSQILSALYCEWDRLTDELSAGPSEDNPGYDQDGLIWAIKGTYALMVKITEIHPDYKYLISDVIKVMERWR